ncbi:hypothetical protein BDA96_05G018100 [Sorghum bicolor]|uniref:Uncharacterized protein n=1 Tax=Sorghum bicolor TaxID=4558 RepID=A0A921UED9_SORBI|nr:hypothetical protein BDA96_05G018100 [Sorghum bicolor]
MLDLVFLLVVRDLIEPAVDFLESTRQFMSEKDLGPAAKQVFFEPFNPALVTHAFQVNLLFTRNSCRY